MVADRTERLFVALELPGHVRRALAQWSEAELAGIEALRRVRPESLHVTLCFLGSRPGVRDRPDRGGLPGGGRASGDPALTLGEPIWLPPRRPRVLAVSLRDASPPTPCGAGPLSALQTALARALTAGGFYAPETRPFLGHVTVARVASGRRAAPVQLAAPEPARSTAARVSLFRSLLGSGPARYESLATVELARSSSGLR